MLCDDVIASLPQLSEGDIQKIRLVLDSIFAETSQVGGSSAPISITYSAIKKAFDKAGLAVTMPQGVMFKKKKDKDAAVWVFDWVQKHFETKTKQEKLRLMTFMLDCLINYLKDIGVPVSIGIVMGNLRNLPRAVDASFPGYVQSGLGSAIVQGVLRCER